jgi:hypothetical protein
MSTIPLPEIHWKPLIYKSITNNKLWICSGWTTATGNTPKKAYDNWFRRMILLYPSIARDHYCLQQTKESS